MSAAKSRHGAHRAPRSLVGIVLPNLLAVLAVVLVVLIVLVVRGEGPGGSGPAVTLGSPSTPSAPSTGAPSGHATAAPTTAAPAPPVATGAPAGPTPTPTAPARTTAPALDKAATPVLVLNNSRIRGLAADAAADLRRGGWTVAGTGNYSGRLPETTVFYAAGDAAQERAAHALAAQFGRVSAVAERFDGLPGSGLTLVVTRYWAR